MRILIGQILAKRGYTVLQARSAEDGLRIGLAHPGPIHLLLTDVIMPGLSGTDLAERLGPRRPEMRVLYMSGYTDTAAGDDGLLPGGGSFLQKPFAPDVLERKVREVLEAGPPED